MPDDQLSRVQLRQLERAFHAGAAEASVAMSRWLSVPSVIVFESLEQRSLSAAGELVGDPEMTLCLCVMDVKGFICGQLAFSFGDASGLSLTDLLLDQPRGTAESWGEIEQSAALESANIIGCAYLNALSKQLSDELAQNVELLPSPPTFRRDFAECLLQSVLLDQVSEANAVFVIRARFELRGQPLAWTLLLVPNAESLARLREALPNA